jgi:hypothetical protein
MLDAYFVDHAQDRAALLDWWRRRALGEDRAQPAVRFQGAVGETAPGAVSTS